MSQKNKQTKGFSLKIQEKSFENTEYRDNNIAHNNFKQIKLMWISYVSKN